MSTAAAAPREPGPLAGVRVLDLTSVVLGPLATQILGDYGADIVKIEGPAGDMMRANGVSRHAGMSSIFLALNRNKRSLCLDLAKPEGAGVLKRLIAGADVFVHNMRVDAMARLGFDYASVAAINPGIVYCVATGFDQDGPDRNNPAFDDIIQAASGLAALASHDQPEPRYVPTLVADKAAGLAVVNAVLAALFHRARNGEGQHVEVPMFETFTAFVLAEHLGGLTFEPQTAPAGYARLLGGGRKPAPTLDGHIALLPYTADHWTAFFRAIGRSDLADTLAVEDREQRNANIRKLYAVLGEITPHRTTAEWLEICRKLDIPATALHALEDLPRHPQLAATDFFAMREHPSEGPLRTVRPTTKFSRTPAAIRALAPHKGQHSRDILAEAGYGAGEIDALLSNNIVMQHQERT